MRLSHLLSAVAMAVLPGARLAAAAGNLEDSDPSNIRAATIYIQPVAATQLGAASPTPPALLAEIHYDVKDPTTAQVVAFEPPEEDAESDGEGAGEAGLYRVGMYHAPSKQWLAGTSVVAASNFAKGYSLHFVLTVSPRACIGVTVRGVAIDAGAMRDFGPQATVVMAGKGVTPSLNRPVVLSPEGKKAEPVEEKTFFQKYWWAIGLALVLTLAGGGGGEEK